MTTIVSKWMVKSGFESNVAEIRPFSQLFPPLQFSVPFSHFSVQSSFCTYTSTIAIFQHYWHDSHLFMDCFPQGVLHKKTFFCVKTTELTQPCYSTPFHQLCCFKHTVPKNVFAPYSKKQVCFQTSDFHQFWSTVSDGSNYVRSSSSIMKRWTCLSSFDIRKTDVQVC